MDNPHAPRMSYNLVGLREGSVESANLTEWFKFNARLEGGRKKYTERPFRCLTMLTKTSSFNVQDVMATPQSEFPGFSC